MCYERSFFQHCVKTGPKRLQLCSFITKTLLLIGRLGFSFSSTTTLKLFLKLRTHLTSHQAIFGCFQHWRALRGRIFSSHSALATAIFQWSQRTLKKRLLWPCNRGISIVKNVYVCRVITLRNDCIFSFLGWVIFFNKLGDLRTWMHHVLCFYYSFVFFLMEVFIFMFLALSIFQLLVGFLGKRLWTASWQSVRMEHLSFYCTDCREVGYFWIFRKVCPENSNSITIREESLVFYMTTNVQL